MLSNYNLIQADFIQWSNKRGMNQNEAYEKIIDIVKSILIPITISLYITIFAPLAEAINDFGNSSLDDTSHFVLLWPKVRLHKLLCIIKKKINQRVNKDTRFPEWSNISATTKKEPR